MSDDEIIRDALPIGTEVGGYVIRRVLGQGGFGITYAASSATGMVERPVAIKEFFPQGLAYRDDKTVSLSSRLDQVAYDAALKRFETEARKLVDDYDHPNILRGENVIHAFNSVFLIMEFIDGVMLHDWVMSRGGVPEKELRALMVPVFDAVEYLHARQAIHRDLSPRNIMIRTMRRGTPVLEPVIIDFGAIGDGLDLVHDSTIAVANPTYSPPEQQEPHGASQGRFTDVFALGGCLYFAATARPPTKPMQRLAAIAHDRPDPLPSAAGLLGELNRFSPAFFEGIDFALKLNPKRRPQTVGDFRDALGWGDAPVNPRAAITIITPVAASSRIAPNQLDLPPAVGTGSTGGEAESGEAAPDGAKTEKTLTAQTEPNPMSEASAVVQEDPAPADNEHRARVDAMAFAAVAAAVSLQDVVQTAEHQAERLPLALKVLNELDRPSPAEKEIGERKPKRELRPPPIGPLKGSFQAKGVIELRDNVVEVSADLLPTVPRMGGMRVESAIQIGFIVIPLLVFGIASAIDKHLSLQQTSSLQPRVVVDSHPPQNLGTRSIKNDAQPSFNVFANGALDARQVIHRTAPLHQSLAKMLTLPFRQQRWTDHSRILSRRL